MSELSPSERFEAIWEELKLLLDWQQGFGLYLIFSDDKKPATLLRQRIEFATRLRTRKLQWVHPEDPQAALQEILGAALDSESDFHRWKSPLWVDLSTGADDDEWQKVRREVLSALNRRRGALEKICQRPVLIQMPTSMAPEIVTWAPDLWSIRQYIASLPSIALDSPDSNPPVLSGQSSHDFVETDNTPNSDEIAVVDDGFSLFNKGTGEVEDEVVRETQKAAEKLEKQGDLNLENGNLASALSNYRDGLTLYRRVYARKQPINSNRLMQCLIKTADCERDCGDYAAATKIYTEYIQIARAVCFEKPDVPGALRNLSIGLNRLGRIQRENGQFNVAIVSCDECCEIRKKIRLLVGDTPQAVRDHAIALSSVGDIHRIIGNIPESLKLQRQALALLRQLARQDGENLPILNDVSVALSALSDVEVAAGRFDAAKKHRIESLDINRKIHAATGDQVPALTNLSTALDKMGDIMRATGDDHAALDCYRENLVIRQKMHASLGDTLQVLRGLTVSVGKLGDISAGMRDFSAALAFFQEAAAFSERLCHTIGETPQTLRSLAVWKAQIANLELMNGNASLAASVFRQCLNIFTRLEKIIGKTPQTQRDIALTIDRLGRCEQESRNEAGALELFDDEIKLLRDSIRDTEGALRLKQDLIRALSNARDIERQLDRHDAARTKQEEIIALWRELEESSEFFGATQALTAEFLVLGDIERRLENHGASAAAFEESAACAEKLLGKKHGDTYLLLNYAIAKIKTAEYHVHRGSKEEALQRYSDARKVLHELLTASGDVLNARLVLAVASIESGKILMDKGLLDEALSRLSEGAEILRLATPETMGGLDAQTDLIKVLQLIRDINTVQGKP